MAKADKQPYAKDAKDSRRTRKKTFFEFVFYRVLRVIFAPFASGC